MRKLSACWLGLALMSVSAFAGSYQSELWVLRAGSVTVFPDRHELGHLGLAIDTLMPSDDYGLTVSIDGATDIAAVVDAGTVSSVRADYVGLTDGLRVSNGAHEVLVMGLMLHEPSLGLVADAEGAVASVGDEAVLILRDVRAGLNPTHGNLNLPSLAVVISDGLARALGDAALAGKSIGQAAVRGSATAVAGAQVERYDSTKSPVERDVRSADQASGGEAQAAGPDMTFCQLYDLRQFGRSGSTLGLALATTSWNVGTADLMWFQNPDPRHPFIVSNLYRLEDDRFQQIGQSWIKHGFFALDSEQCGTPCTYEPGHGVGAWLGVGCTDTYTSSLNASQSGLGPRYEVDPWTGAYRYQGSHLSASHNHDGEIDHRLQVQEADVSPTVHPTAQWFVEGYYVVADDVDHMNNAAWKEVFPNEPIGSTWAFSMSGASTPAAEGFAIDRWTDARQSVIAEVVPPVELESSDGRCILAAKAVEVGADRWRYEYALLNIDLDRKISSFSVPVYEFGDVQNIGFHHAPHHDEPFSNLAWTAVVENGAITWSTDENPLRWGTMHNFWFEVNGAPVDTTVTLGHYETGAPETLSGVTTGPVTTPPVCLESDPALPDAGGIRNSRFLSIVPGNAGEETAIRVTLDSLLDDPADTAGQPDFAAFEGQFRWVGPPAVYSEQSPGGETFVGAQLQCEPYFHDWGTIGLLHVHGSEIIPYSSYTVQHIHTTCLAALDNEQAYSSGLEVVTAYYADVVAPFGYPGITAPVDFNDIAAIVNKFLGSLEPPQVRAQLTPNVVDVAMPVDFKDIAASVESFLGNPYSLPGPIACPDS